MHRIDRGGFGTDKRRRRGAAKGLALSAAVLFLFLLASGANAYVCSDCHTGPTNPHGALCNATDCTSCHAGKNIMHPAGAGTPSVCTACHTTTPHPTVGAGTSLDSACVTSACHGAGGTAHLFTATGLVPYGTIHTGISVPSTACSACHGAGGITPSEHVTPTATCASCHSRPGAASTMVLAHPEAVGGPSHACSTCHTVGVKPNEVDACANSSCHGPGGTAHLRNDLDTLRMLAVEMHVPADIPRALECTGCHNGVFEKPFAHPAGGAECSACHPRAGVSPADVETCKTCHDSGPAHKFSEATLTTRAHDMHQFGASVPSTICTDCHGTKTLYYPMGPITCIECHTASTKAAAFAACITCHSGMTNASDVGKDIHISTPRPNFTAQCDTITSNKMNFDASSYSNTCPDGYTCTYSWDFGQSGGTTTNANTSTPTHTYTSSGSFSVTLTMTAAGGGSASVTKSLTTCTVNQPPACGRTAIFYSPGNTVYFTDASTDDGVGGVALVSVNWGDSKTDVNKPLLTSFSHTYAAAGTYLLIQSVMDAAGAISECPRQYVTPVPAGAKFNVTVNMSKTAAYASVKVLLNGSIKSQGSTGAAGLTWTSASLPANAGYTLSVMKVGKTFSCNGATVDLSTGNQTVECTVTP